MQLHGTTAISVSYSLFRLPFSCRFLRWHLNVIFLQSVLERDGTMTELRDVLDNNVKNGTRTLIFSIEFS